MKEQVLVREKMGFKGRLDKMTSFENSAPIVSLLFYFSLLFNTLYRENGVKN